MYDGNICVSKIRNISYLWSLYVTLLLRYIITIKSNINKFLSAESINLTSPSKLDY